MAFGHSADRAMLRRYRTLRCAGKTFATKLTHAMPRSVIIGAARNLGLWKRGALVAEQYELDVLMDRAIYDEKWDGRSSLDRFLETSPAARLTEDERRFCEIMGGARLSLFQVVRVVPGSGVTLVDRLAERLEARDAPAFDVMDLEMSKSVVAGFLFATRLLNAGAF